MFSPPILTIRLCSNDSLISYLFLFCRLARLLILIRYQIVRCGLLLLLTVMPQIWGQSKFFLNNTLLNGRDYHIYTAHGKFVVTHPLPCSTFPVSKKPFSMLITYYITFVATHPHFCRQFMYHFSFCFQQSALSLLLLLVERQTLSCLSFYISYGICFAYFFECSYCQINLLNIRNLIQQLNKLLLNSFKKQSVNKGKIERNIGN